MTNAERFIQLQDKANQEIDTLGQTTEETFNALDTLSNTLTHDEIDDALAIKVKCLTAKIRLEYLRNELRAERISYGELAELQSLIPYIDKGDVELLEAAGVPEN